MELAAVPDSLRGFLICRATTCCCVTLAWWWWWWWLPPGLLLLCLGPGPDHDPQPCPNKPSSADGPLPLPLPLLLLLLLRWLPRGGTPSQRKVSGLGGGQGSRSLLRVTTMGGGDPLLMPLPARRPWWVGVSDRDREVGLGGRGSLRARRRTTVVVSSLLLLLLSMLGW